MEVFLKIRYLILLMGFFATYMGFIYNDFMSLPLEFFGKGCYEADEETGKYELLPGQGNCVYAFGFDPVWMASA
jgi:V-type H+-transporting ATPase subunit a